MIGPSTISRRGGRFEFLLSHREWHTSYRTGMGKAYLFRRMSNRGGLSVQENEACPQSLTTEENQLGNEFHPQFPSPEHVVSPHMQDRTPPRDSKSDSLKLRVQHLLEKGGGIPHLDRQVMKTLWSEWVSIKQFLDDISKSKRKYLYGLTWKVEELPLFKTKLIHQSIMSGWMSSGMR